MQTLVKLMLRFTTKVTTSPTWRWRSSSAASVRAARSRPVTCARRSASASETSAPPRAPSSTRRTSRVARSNAASRLPATPVLMALLDATVAVDQVSHPRPQRLVNELGPRGVLGIDGEALSKGEAGRFRRRAEGDEAGPGAFGADVIERERRHAA